MPVPPAPKAVRSKYGTVSSGMARLSQRAESARALIRRGLRRIGDQGYVGSSIHAVHVVNATDSDQATPSARRSGSSSPVVSLSKITGGKHARLQRNDVGIHHTLNRRAARVAELSPGSINPEAIDRRRRLDDGEPRAARVCRASARVSPQSGTGSSSPACGGAIVQRVGRAVGTVRRDAAVGSHVVDSCKRLGGPGENADVRGQWLSVVHI